MTLKKEMKEVDEKTIDIKGKQEMTPDFFL